MPAHIQFSENSIVISDTNRPLFAIGMLVLLALVAFSIPIALTFFALGESSLGAGILVSYLLCWWIAAYFIRLALWNLYGQEVIQISACTIAYHCSYGFFTDNKTTLTLEKEDLYGLYIFENTDNNLIIANETTVIEINQVLPEAAYISIASYIFQHLARNQCY